MTASDADAPAPILMRSSNRLATWLLLLELAYFFVIYCAYLGVAAWERIAPTRTLFGFTVDGAGDVLIDVFWGPFTFAFTLNLVLAVAGLVCLIRHPRAASLTSMGGHFLNWTYVVLTGFVHVMLLAMLLDFD